MFALGWMVYTVFRIFLNRDFSLKNMALLALSFYLLAVVKIYILMAFLPALSIWLLMSYSKRIRSSALRLTTRVLVICACIAGLVLLSQSLSAELGRYSLDNLANTAKVTQDYISDVSDAEGGSAYDLGKFEPTLTGMLSKFPQGVVVTLFRPFLWEVKKPIMLLSALESSVFVFLILYVLFKREGPSAFKMISQDPNLLFFFTYSLIFAFAVGVSTGNFGTLSRYKIPCMPFFAALLLILYAEKKSQNSSQTNC